MFSKIKAIKDLRDQAKQMQSIMDSVVADGSAGWGKLTMKMNGSQKILSIDIADELLSDKAKLIELFIEAHDEAVKNMQKALAERMKDSGSIKDMMKSLGM